MYKRIAKVFLFFVIFGLIFISTPVSAHRSGCHRWHSCPSDSGSYTCGDAGYPCQYPTYPADGGVIYPPDGYYKDCYDCPIKKVPENAHTSGIDWACDAGYERDEILGKCVKIIQINTVAPAPKISSSCNDGYSWNYVQNKCTKIIVINTAPTPIPKSRGQVLGTTTDTQSNNQTVIEREKSLFSSVDDSLVNKVKGKILLQVESAGEAWYVNPDDDQKYYLGYPRDAFNLMRTLGIGISDQDLWKIPLATDYYDADGPALYPQVFSDLVDRLKGKILLRVEHAGEAWYVNPEDGNRYYMGRPADAFALMRKLGLGITNVDLRKIGVGEL